MFGGSAIKGVGLGITAPGSGISSHGIWIRPLLAAVVRSETKFCPCFWNQGSEIFVQKWDQQGESIPRSDTVLRCFTRMDRLLAVRLFS